MSRRLCSIRVSEESRAKLKVTLICGLVLGCMAGMALPGLAAEAHKRPNILFIFCDDHAYQAISAYQQITPFQTGKYSHLNGFYCNGDRFDGTQQTFPKLLRRSGYQTAVIGKWHLGEHMAPQGYDYSEVLIGQGPYYNPTMLRDADGDGQHDGRVQHTGYTTDIITDLALDWLKHKRDPKRPFMLMMQHKAPHRNWQPGPKYLNLYDDVTIPEPDTLFDDYKGRGTPAKTQDMTIARTMNASDLKLVAPRGLTPEQLARWNAAYEPKNEAFRQANLSGEELVRWK